MAGRMTMEDAAMSTPESLADEINHVRARLEAAQALTAQLTTVLMEAYQAMAVQEQEGPVGDRISEVLLGQAGVRANDARNEYPDADAWLLYGTDEDEDLTRRLEKLRGQVEDEEEPF